MGDKMNMSLDDIISSGGPVRSKFKRAFGRGGRRGGRPVHHQVPYDKPARPELEQNWTHEMYDDPKPKEAVDEEATVLKISNLHWNVSEKDLQELFGSIGPLVKVKVYFDNAGRSEGRALVIYENHRDALDAKEEYSKRELDGQEMQIELEKRRVSKKEKEAAIKQRLGTFVGSLITQRLGSKVESKPKPKRNRQKPKTKEDLDADMDAFMAQATNN